MPTQTSRTRGYFHSIMMTLVRAIGDVFEHELALRRKPKKAPGDEQEIARLFAVRSALQDSVAQVRGAEIDYLSSAIALNEATSRLAGPPEAARAQLRFLKRLDSALVAAKQIVGIATGLTRLFA